MNDGRTGQCTAIVAVASNGVIGRDGGLPWRLPADLKHFKALTLGHGLLMGRRTWESIGRPLPGRRSLVLTRSAGWQAEGAEAVASMDEARALLPQSQTLFIIGGAEVYQACWPRVDRIELTEVHAEVEGDTRLQGLERNAWREVARVDHPADGQHDHGYSFVTLVRQ